MSLQILKEKLQQLEQDLEHSHKEIEKILTTKHQPNSNHIYCYFTQSIILDHNQQDNHLIMGNFHVKNVSNETMHSPVILLKINSKTEFNFTGKYKSASQESKAYQFDWERLTMEDLDPITHYCFKPTQKNQLLPDEQLSFQSFQMIIPDNAAIHVEGFTYFNQSNDGIPAINSIDISV